MADSFVDMSQVEKWASSLASSSLQGPALMRKLASGAGIGLKTQMRKEASGIQGNRVAAAISYDVKSSLTGFEIECGPVTGRAGSLAFFYYGNRKIGPRIADPVFALRDEAAKTAEAVTAGIVALLARGAL